MSLKLEKCKFNLEELKFLCHSSTKDRILPDEDRFEATEKFPTTKTKKQLCVWLLLQICKQ